MFIGKVVGNVWATRKADNLKGLRFLIVHPYNLKKATNDDIVVCADIIGAGIGETVLVAYGHAARMCIGDPNISIEAAVVGIVDSIELVADDPSHLKELITDPPQGMGKGVPSDDGC